MKILAKNKTRSNLRRGYSWELGIFIILGLSIFCLNSFLELNYFVKNYLLILEIQSSIVIVYFIMMKLRKVKKSKKNLQN